MNSTNRQFCVCVRVQEYSVQLTFREQWTDERLKFDDIQGKLKSNAYI